MVTESASTKSRPGRARTHVYERAVIDAVGDDTNAPVCDGSDLRLLLVLIRRINCPRLRVALCGRGCGHGTLFFVVTQVIHKRFLRQRTISPGICNHGPQKLADNTRPQRWGTESEDLPLKSLSITLGWIDARCLTTTDMVDVVITRTSTSYQEMYWDIKIICTAR